jgi:cytochrome c oxidase assembly protein subunit 15
MNPPLSNPSARLAALLALVLCFVVIVLGAWVRLSHAGLGCPDWPGCYGEITWPDRSPEIEAANREYPERPVEIGKAWREMVHRYAAGSLGLIVFVLALAAAWRDRAARAGVILAAIGAALGIVLYSSAAPTLALAAGGLGIALPLLAAWRLNAPGHRRLIVATLGVIIFQALLGKWTVTLQLKPIVVTSHLLGGMTTFALLLWYTLRLHGVGRTADRTSGRVWVALALIAVAIQIALGGWVSANYAALSCGVDFPRCIGQWWPAMDWREAFVLWRGIGVNYEGGVLDGATRIAIQIAHRGFALVVLLVVGAVALRWLLRTGFRAHAAAIGTVLALQLALGIANVVNALPLAVATTHNAMAAVLLGLLVGLLARLTPSVSR